MSVTTDSQLSDAPREWFCLRTQTKREHIAAAVLAKIEAVETFCPRISQVKKTRSGKRRYIEALFPGYIFARFSYSDHYRQVIHSQGVTGLVGRGKQKAIPGQVIANLRSTLPEAITEVPDPSIEPGAHIQFVSGALKGLNGKVLAQLPSENRIQILLTFLGQEMTVIASTDDILLASEDT